MDRALNLYTSGDRSWREWNQAGDPADLDCAIAAFRKAKALYAEGSEPARFVAASLGICLTVRHLLTRSVEDREEAIGYLSDLPGGDDPEHIRDSQRLTLADLLLSRATETVLPEHPGERGWQDLERAAAIASRAVASPDVNRTDQGRARGLRAQAAGLLALIRARRCLEDGKAPDLAELQAAHGTFPADDPYRPVLTMILGAALGERAVASGSGQEWQQAIDCLTGSLEASINAGERGDAPERWHSFALARLLPLTFCRTASDLDRVPADRLLSIARRALRQPSHDQEEAVLWHILAGQAYFARTIRDGQLGEIEQALASVRTALELLSEEHFLRAPLAMYVSTMLQYRFLAGGSLVDGDAATAYLPASDDLVGLADDNPDGGPDLRLLDAYRILGLENPLLGGQQDSAGPAIARLRQALGGLPEGNRDRCGLMGLLGVVLLTCAQRPGDDPATEEGLTLLTQAADQAGEESPYYAHLNDAAAMWLARAGTARKDIRLIDDAIRRVSGPIPRPGLVSGERLRRARTLGSLLGDRYMLSGRSRDIDRSIEILARCQRHLGKEPSWRAALLLLELAQSYRIRGLRLIGDRQRAIKTGMAGLLAAVGDVLLQTDTRRGLQAARGVRSWAGLVALWCLIDDQPDRAVQALELGRSLVLRAATVAADVPGLLRAAGHDDLAGSWQREAGGAQPQFDLSALGEDDAAYLSALLEPMTDEGTPSDIRRRVLAALGDAPIGAGLLAPPPIEELAEGLRGTSFDAFVYLLPPDPTWTRDGEYRPGCALMVRRDGQVREIPLPRLTPEPVAKYAEAYQAWIADLDNLSLHSRWDRALDGVCDWAWDVLVSPVLSHAAGWRLARPPRLVLIPTGNLGIVPWHAARTTRADGGPHYAVEDAVWSYAASARQQINASGRARRPWADSPVLLADTTGDLPMAALEAHELRRVFYPGAVLVGDSSSDASMTEEVLARLPGGSAEQASLLHCCCHASVCGDLSASFLQLADGQRLTVGQLMAQAQGRDQRSPGYLAVLSACTSDFADVDHDEALTLASALLAAGASGVVGTRWPVGDSATAQMMVAFHRFLAHTDASPADALRAAQLWMLDRDRAIPGDLVPELARQAKSGRLHLIRNWAAFTYQGV